MSSYLRGPNQEDLTTECGSHILDELIEHSKGSLTLTDHSLIRADNCDDLDITLDLTFEQLPEKEFEIRACSLEDAQSQITLADECKRTYSRSVVILERT